MGWLTGQDKGTKARTEARRRVRKCGRCNRPLNGSGSCPVCSAISRTQSKSAGPCPCPRCGKTMRGGVCPGAFC
jgi:hypothetical protein